MTRVNASSISTGAYPETHGLLGNTVFFPKVDPAKFLDTADRNSLVKVAEVEGRLLTARTLGESLQAAGRKMLVVSSGSTGSAFLNNHMVSGGAILHYRYALPEPLAEDMKTLGPAPAEGAPAGALDRYAVDAFLKVGIPRVDPSVTVMWLSDLDTAAHAQGVGAPATVEVLRHVDGEIKRTQDGLKAAGLFDSYNIWVTSDHGFSTHTGAIDLDTVLKPFAGTLPDGSPRIVASGGAIYVRDGDQAAVTSIVATLQKTAGVGAIFTRAAQPGSFDGSVPGTLSFDVARWNHERSAQILFSPDWTDAANAHGMRGTVASGGTAGHGSSSPWDIHNTLDCRRARPEAGRHGRHPKRERRLRADLPAAARHGDSPVRAGTAARGGPRQRGSPRRERGSDHDSHGEDAGRHVCGHRHVLDCQRRRAGVPVLRPDGRGEEVAAGKVTLPGRRVSSCAIGFRSSQVGIGRHRALVS